MTGHCGSVVFLVLFVVILLMGRTSVECVLSTFTLFARQIPFLVLIGQLQVCPSCHGTQTGVSSTFETLLPPPPVVTLIRANNVEGYD